jgi:hypothetical protein
MTGSRRATSGQPRVDVQGQEPKDLVGGGLQVAVAGQADAREVLTLGDLRLGP